MMTTEQLSTVYLHYDLGLRQQFEIFLVLIDAGHFEAAATLAPKIREALDKYGAFLASLDVEEEAAATDAPPPGALHPAPENVEQRRTKKKERVNVVTPASGPDLEAESVQE